MSDRHTRTLARLTLNIEVTCVFGRGPPEYRRKLSEQCITVEEK